MNISIRMEKIFVSAFSCMPGVGSEPGVGWHWVMEMSKYYELWVLVHKEQCIDIEVYVKQNGIDKKIHFIYYDIPFNSLFFKDGKFRWVRTYYFLWTILSNKIVKRTMQTNGIKIFHHLTFGNAIWSVSSYGQKQFFIWGPVGGVETISSEFSQYYDWKNRLIEAVRRITVRVLKQTPGFNNRCRNANLIFCKTEAMQNFIPARYRQKAILFTDVAVDSIYKVSNNNHFSSNKPLRYIAVGRLDAWRGFDILIEAFNQAVKVYPQIELSILGDGSDKCRLEKLIYKYKIADKVKLLGSVSTDEYKKIISECDVVVNSCLKEGAVTVSFDSMLYGKPLICIDSGGYTKYFTDEYAIVLQRQSRTPLISSLSDALIKLTDANLREQMGKKAAKQGDLFSWEKKGIKIYDLYKNKLSHLGR